MSQEQFGELLDTTRQTVSKWELDQVVPDVRKLIAICEKNVKTKQITYAYYYLDESGKKCVVSNCEGYDGRLGTEKFDRKRLEKMERIDSFLINHGEYPLHTVYELGIRSYGQYYRLRNFQDNSKPFCGCCFDFDYQMPKEQYGIDCTKMACSLAGGANQDEDGAWFLRRLFFKPYYL